MHLKKIIIIIVTVLCSFMFLSSTSVFALEANSKDFSSYINCYKGDVYTKSTTISPLTRNNKYNVGTKCYAQYKEYDITGKARANNYGFKVNNEFYVSPVTLSESGTYLIEVFSIKKENNIIKPKGSALETFYVFVDLEFELKLKTKNYATDLYDSPAEFIEDLEKNFSEKVAIKSESDALLRSTFLNCKKNKVQETITIKVIFENVEYPFDITILSSSEDIKKTFVNIGQASLNIKPIAVEYDPEYKGEYVSTCLKNLIGNRVLDDLNLAPEQSVSFEFRTDKTYPTLSSVDYKILSLELYIEDELDKTNSVVVDIYLLVYQTYYITDEMIKIDFTSNDYLEKQTIVNEYQTYLCIEFGDSKYYDYDAKINTTFNLDTTNKKLTYNLKYHDLNVNQTIIINIVDSISTFKIVTNYNYIVLPEKESLLYKEQIGVLINGELYKAKDVKDYYFKYNFVEEENADYIVINLYDASTNEEISSKKARILYENFNNDNFFQKILKGYGNFLRKLF